jgi:hypothetical protein
VAPHARFHARRLDASAGWLVSAADIGGGAGTLITVADEFTVRLIGSAGWRDFNAINSRELGSRPGLRRDRAPTAIQLKD